MRPRDPDVPGAEPPDGREDGQLTVRLVMDVLRVPDRLKWYTEAELYNGRWAMAGVFGIIHQEALGKAGLIKDIPWFNTGYELKDEFPIAAQLGVLFPLFGFLELTRYEGFKKTGECGVINMFPFDPLGLKSEKMKEREVKNGRLAMMAFVGFVVQALVCRQGPLDCLYGHIADPFHNNILTNIVQPAGATYPGM